MCSLPLSRALAGLLASARLRLEGDSMCPTLQNGQYVLARRIRYPGAPFQRGDIVALLYPRDLETMVVKRVIGLPGEHLRLAEDAVYVNELPLAESYLDGPPCPVGRHALQWIMGPEEYFVMGDNRFHSTDSRDFGPVLRAQISGRVWFRCWPPQAWGRLV